MPCEIILKSLGFDSCSNDYLLSLIVHIALTTISVYMNWLLLAMVQYLYHLYSINNLLNYSDRCKGM